MSSSGSNSGLDTYHCTFNVSGSIDNNYNNDNLVERDYEGAIRTNGADVNYTNDTNAVDSDFSSSIITASDDTLNASEAISVISDDHIQIHCPTTIDENNSTLSIPTKSLTCSEVYDKLQTCTLPMLDFCRDLDNVMSTGQDSLLDVYNLFNRYIDLLRDYYYELFTEQCKEFTAREQCGIVGGKILQECAAAMRGALPHSINLQLADRGDGYKWSIEVL